MPQNMYRIAKEQAIFLVASLVVWTSQIIYLWPAPPFVAKESVELLGTEALWIFYFKWLGLVAFGLFGVFAIYKRHRFWPAAVFLSSVLYLWAVHFPVYIAAFFTNIESLEQLPGRLRLLVEGLSSVALLHMQFLSPLFFMFAAVYAVVSYVRASRPQMSNVSNSGI
jgi:hypothetical protein